VAGKRRKAASIGLVAACAGAVAGGVLVLHTPTPTPITVTHAVQPTSLVGPAPSAGPTSDTAAPPTSRGSQAPPGESWVHAPCEPAVEACVQPSTQHAWLVEDGHVVDDGFIASGVPGHETPTGVFHVQWKDKDHYSSEYDTPMHYAVFFDSHGRALHQGPLDKPSMGCVHLAHDVAVQFFRHLQPGDECRPCRDGRDYGT
jgi:lipoprotein-anchoring transpeptidase ErfK/SrfK